MRVIICGDSHIGAIHKLGGPNGRGGNTRIDDYSRTLNHIVDYCIDTQADVFVQSGDMFDSCEPSIEYLNIVDSALKRLSRANILAIVIMGNHDYQSSGETFTSPIMTLSARDFPNVRLVLKPQVVQVINNREEKVNIVLIPFRHRKMYQGKTNQERSEQFDAHVQSLIQSCDQSPIISIGHNFFYEGDYRAFSGGDLLLHPKNFQNTDLVVMGHQHHFRVLRKENPTALYIGSMDKLHFADTSVDKFFVDYSVEDKSAKIHKVPSRPLADEVINLAESNLEDYQDNIIKEISEIDLDGKIVRMRILVRDALLSVLKKPWVKELLYQQGAFYVSNVIFEPVYRRVVKDNSVLDNKTDADKFEGFVKSQDFDDSVKNSLIKLGKQIMEEVGE